MVLELYYLCLLLRNPTDCCIRVNISTGKGGMIPQEALCGGKWKKELYSKGKKSSCLGLSLSSVDN